MEVIFQSMYYGSSDGRNCPKETQELCDADDLYLYSDRLFASADTLATAEVLNNGIKKMNTGKQMDIVFWVIVHLMEKLVKQGHRRHGN